MKIIQFYIKRNLNIHFSLRFGKYMPAGLDIVQYDKIGWNSMLRILMDYYVTVSDIQE